MSATAATAPLWTPSAGRVAASAMDRFRRRAEAVAGRAIPDQPALWDWSVEDIAGFWSLVWDFCGVIGDKGGVVLADGERMPGARFFPEARLNYAENLLRGDPAGEALVFRGEDKVERRLTHGRLKEEVARLAAHLRAEGVGPGDRVAGFVANMPEAIIGLLATASIGAIWSSCSPDFGAQGVLDRFGQIEPKVLLAVDGYWYAGKRIDCHDKLAEITSRLPSLKRVVVIPYLNEAPDTDGLTNAVTWAGATEPHAGAPLTFDRGPFDRPLYILYSSGTTGVPKCIVHGAGGSLLQHLKEHALHSDVRPGDRVFYFTTCGWMMWNWLVSGLAAGASLMLFDGSPFHPSGEVLWDYAQAERFTLFGTSAKYIDSLLKAGIRPKDSHDLAHLRAVCSTGSPLSPDGFAYVYEAVKEDVQLSSISGGTDIVSCFVLGSPVLPVWTGEIQCRGLGMAVECYDDDARPLRGDKGELVCLKPFPSMPVMFWADPDGAKYRAAYFERFPGIWCHGDFVEITGHGGMIIHGRSDATLNPGGVRIGTAEIYRQVERLPEVLESLVIGQDWDNDVRVVLFVRLREGGRLSDDLVARIRSTIRVGASPRHVPAKILEVADIPRTKSGKIVELAVRDVVHGRPVKNIEALANPEALALFKDRPELKS